MPKFYVAIGMLVRKQALVVVEAPSEEDIDPDEVYELYDDSNWEYDDSWGCEKSKCNHVVGPAPEDAVVEIVLGDDDEDEDDEEEE